MRQVALAARVAPDRLMEAPLLVAVPAVQSVDRFEPVTPLGMRALANDRPVRAVPAFGLVRVQVAVEDEVPFDAIDVGDRASATVGGAR